MYKYFFTLQSKVNNAQIAILLLCIILDIGLSILSIILIMPLLDVIQQNPEATYSLVTQYCSYALSYTGFSLNIASTATLFLAINFLKPLSNYMLQYITILIKYSFLYNVLNGVLGQIFNSKWEKVEDVTTGVIVNAFTKEIHGLGDGVSLMVTRLITVVQLLSYILVPLFLDFYLTTLVLAGFVISALPFLLLVAMGKKLGQKNLDSANNLISFVTELTRNLKMFVATNTGNFALNKFRVYFSAHLSANVRSQLFDRSTSVFFRPLALSVVVMILIYNSQVENNITNVITILWSLVSIVPILNQLIQNRISLSILESSFIQIRDLKNSLTQNVFTKSGAEKLNCSYDIIFKDVSYFIDRVCIIKNLNFVFPKSKVSCIIGASGSGKSTLVNLILGLNMPSSGEIYYDNTNARFIDYRFLRENVGYVSQESVKLNGSIRDNIFWRESLLTDDELDELMSLSDCEFIKDFRMQLDQVVGENGIQLSGGQWQRLAILRALVNKPSLLLLDEATSSLDMSSELKIIEGLKSLSWKPTIILISHRTGPIEASDEILDLNTNFI